MFVIRVALHVQAEKFETFERLAIKEAAEVPAQFRGCRLYGFSRQLGEPGHYLLIEEWEDHASFLTYKKSDYFIEVGQRLRPMLAGPPNSAYFDATPVPVT